MIIDPVIYAIINVVNEKHYVGQASDKLKRFREHKKTLRGNYHCNVLLQRAFNKYGEDKFIFVVLENLLSCDQLNAREQHWIDLLKPEYNLAPVAGSLLGYKHSEEARENMSEAHKGRKHSAETRAKMSAARMGNKNAAGSKRSKEHMDALLANNRGKPKSLEHKAKIGAGNRGKFVSEETRQRQSEAARNRKKKALDSARI